MEKEDENQDQSSYDKGKTTKINNNSNNNPSNLKRPLKKRRRNFEEDIQSNKEIEEEGVEEEKEEGENNNDQSNNQKGKERTKGRNKNQIEEEEEEEEEEEGEEEGNEENNDHNQEKQLEKTKRRRRNYSKDIVIPKLENGEVDMTKTTLKDLIRTSQKLGKPTKATQLREEARKQRLKDKKKNLLESNTVNEEETRSPSLPVEKTPDVSMQSEVAEGEETIVGVIPDTDEDEEENEEEKREKERKAEEEKRKSKSKGIVGPRVKIIDGKMVLDEESLVIEQSDEGMPTDQVYESSSTITSSSFMKRTPSVKWSQEETQMFYKALRQYGTDFALIETMFPNRTRHQIKLKFKKEEKVNPKIISSSLRNPLAVDVDEYRALALAANKLPKPKELEEPIELIEAPKEPEAPKVKPVEPQEKPRKARKKDKPALAEDEEIIGIIGDGGETVRYDGAYEDDE